jgi:hypothetical protein
LACFLKKQHSNLLEKVPRSVPSSPETQTPNANRTRPEPTARRKETTRAWTEAPNAKRPTPNAKPQTLALPPSVERLFPSCHAGCAVQIRQLWGGTEPGPTTWVRPNRLRQSPETLTTLPSRRIAGQRLSQKTSSKTRFLKSTPLQIRQLILYFPHKLTNLQGN